MTQSVGGGPVSESHAAILLQPMVSAIISSWNSGEGGTLDVEALVRRQGFRHPDARDGDAVAALLETTLAGAGLIQPVSRRTFRIADGVMASTVARTLADAGFVLDQEYGALR